MEAAGSNPAGDADALGYANRQSDEAQTFVIVWVRLPPPALDTRRSQPSEPAAQAAATLGIGEPNRL